MKVIVIGGVAAGMSAASKIRRSRYQSEVTVYEKGGTLSYGACGLPYYVGDEIKDHNKMIIRTKDDFEKIGININLYHEVIGLDENNKKVIVKNLLTGDIFEDNYDKLLISTGAKPVIPPWPGIEHPMVKTLSTIEDGKEIKTELLKDDVKDIVIIGAGFIGVELVEAAGNLGKNVTLIEYKNQILPHLDKEMAADLQEELKRNKVNVKTGEKVLELDSCNEVIKVLTDKNCYNADLVIVSVGVRPNTDFLEGTSIQRISNGAILVDKDMKTSVEDIYSAGDCATVFNRVKDSLDAYIPLGTNANKQGKLAGMAIVGERARYIGTLGTSMIKVFDMEGAKTGLSEQEAILENYDYKTVTIKSLNHAPYYPNPEPIKIKLVVERKTKKILGAQAVGYPGTALRINTFALAIHTGIPVDELGWVDFGYAPPFAEVWDAIHIACNAVK